MFLIPWFPLATALVLRLVTGRGGQGAIHKCTRQRLFLLANAAYLPEH